MNQLPGTIAFTSILITLLISAIVLSAGCNQQTSLDFIQSSTGIIFPSDPEIFEIYDNQEFYMTSYLKYKKIQVDRWLVCLENIEFSGSNFDQDHWFDNLSHQPDFKPEARNIKLVQGRSEHHQWTILIDHALEKFGY